MSQTSSMPRLVTAEFPRSSQFWPFASGARLVKAGAPAQHHATALPQLTGRSHSKRPRYLHLSSLPLQLSLDHSLLCQTLSLLCNLRPPQCTTSIDQLHLSTCILSFLASHLTITHSLFLSATQHEAHRLPCRPCGCLSGRGSRPRYQAARPYRRRCSSQRRPQVH